MKNLICEDFAIYIDDLIHYIYVKTRLEIDDNEIKLFIVPTLSDKDKNAFVKSDKEGYRKMVGDFRKIPKGEYECTKIKRNEVQFIKIS